MKITTIPQLDDLINKGRFLSDMIVDPSVFSPEMKVAYELLNAGTVALHQGELARAIQQFRIALARWPSFVAAHVNLADCYIQVGEWDSALELLNQAHSLAPDDPDIHMTAAKLYDTSDDKKREIEQYFEALKDYPIYIPPRVNLGAAYREVGKLDESERWLLEALSQVDDQERIMKDLGWQHPEKVRIHLNLAETFEAKGDWRRAVTAWEAVVRRNSYNEYAARLENARRRAQQTQKRKRWFWQR